MPEISRFLGIIVAMYYNDHEPPHFHVRYSNQKAMISIDDMRLLKGRLSPRVLGLVVEWALLHQDELFEDWGLAKQKSPLKQISPLE